MKTTYVYFGKRGYYVVAPGADEATPALSIANSGMFPDNQNVDQTDLTSNMRVYIQTVNDGGSGTRGTAYGTVDFNGIAITSADPAVGDVVRVPDVAFRFASQILTIEDASSDDTSYGYDMHASDIVHVHEAYAADLSGVYEQRSAGAAYPMSNFLGAEPVAYDFDYYNGNTGTAGSPSFTALDQTDLHFKSTISNNTSHIVRIIHTAGKYRDICKLMERLDSCGVYDKAVTFYDFDTNGNETFLSPTMGGDNELGIVGLWHVPSA